MSSAGSEDILRAMATMTSRVHPWRAELAGLTVMNGRGYGQQLGAVVVVWLAGAVAAGCVPSGVPAERGEGIVVVERGLAERLALMDRDRLHDEDRKRMMRRPHVWAEEVPDDEAPRSDDCAAAPGSGSSSSCARK